MKLEIAAGCLAFVVAFSPRAQAQAGGADKASAEALFNEGVALVASENYAEGCRKFEGSQALDPTLGTELRLADCYERSGKTASAWASFKHAQGVARVQNQTDREELARQRVEALEPKLAYLSLELEGAAPSGMLVERNGRPVPLASLGVAIPVDPGEQKLSASAPGYATWNETLQVAAGPSKASLRIPTLQRREAPPPARAASEPSATSSPQRTLGIVTGAVGVAGILVGSGFGLYAMKEGDRSKEDGFCPTDGHNGCTQAGVDLRDRARTFGTVSTIGFVAGAVLVTTGVVLFTTAPKNGIQLRAGAAPGALGTSLRGVW
jgi:hypothetical protein